MSSMIEISGLWKNTSKDGKTTYLVGYMGKAKILIFPNSYKEEDKHPDYIFYIDEKPVPSEEVGEDIAF